MYKILLQYSRPKNILKIARVYYCRYVSIDRNNILLLRGWADMLRLLSLLTIFIIVVCKHITANVISSVCAR